MSKSKNGLTKVAQVATKVDAISKPVLVICALILGAVAYWAYHEFVPNHEFQAYVVERRAALDTIKNEYIGTKANQEMMKASLEDVKLDVRGAKDKIDKMMELLLSIRGNQK